MMRLAQLRSLVLAAPAILALVGCAEESGVKEETEITTPQGTTTITKETEVETTGENPPLTGGTPSTTTTTTTPGTNP